MNRFSIYLLVGLLGLTSARTWAQTAITPQQAKKLPPRPAIKPDTARYQLLGKGKYFGDSVVLRWSASDAVLWQLANRAGYTIDRLEKKDGQIINRVTLVKQLKPWTLAEWKQRCRPQDTTAALAAQMLYGVTKGLPTAAGGSLNAVMDQRNDAENRFFVANMLANWSPFHAASMALRYADKTAQKGRQYIYLISSPVNPKLMSVDTVMVPVRTIQPEPLEKMTPVVADPGDHVIRLKWSRLMGDVSFTGYYYERSDDGGKTFRRLNRKPFLKLSEKASNGDGSLNDYIFVTDSIPQNYRKYIYRVTGINHFGELSPYCDNVVTMGLDLAPPSAVATLRAENPVGNTVVLTWEKPKKEGDFIGYIVGRGPAISGPFEPIQKALLPPSASRFEDKTADPFGTNFYVVSAIDTAGNGAQSLPAYVVMRDDAPPAKPTGLRGTIDSTGVVRLSWTRNTEPDLMGYMVYTANAPDHAFTNLTTDFLADEFFTDTTTLRTLTKYKYVRVVAFDKSRKASPYSEIAELKRPDRIAPVSPVFNNFLVADSSVTLRWVRSSSDDVAGQWLYRKEEGKDTDYQLLTEFSQERSDYVDRTVLPRRGYAYALVAVDDSQNKSPLSFPMRVRTYDAGVRKGTQNLTATAPPDKPISLRWNGATSGTGRVLVYRKIGEEPLRLIDNVPGSQQTYLDASLQKGTYQYALKTVYADGGESPLTAFVRVERL